MESAGTVAKNIAAKLQAAFEPAKVDVLDESALHAGHEGAREGGESHFRVTIESAAFEGLSRVERQRRVNAALREELAGPVHALSIRAVTPGEAASV